MRLVQSRIMTDDVARLAMFYQRLVGAPAPVNEYYVEVTAGECTIGLCKPQFTAYQLPDQPGRPASTSHPGQRDPAGSGDRIILDFQVDDVDGEFSRVAALSVDWVLEPTTQPWGSRSMMFRDPGGNLVNVFSRLPGGG
jgi:predicted enzyme related to lactoylglutathione lyase